MITAATVNLALLIVGFSCWSISTMTAGGGSVLIIVVLAMLLRGHAIAPVVTVGSAFASPARIILFWRHIDWRVVRWYLPGATAGAMLGAWAFSRASADVIQICVGLFLVSTVWQFRSGGAQQALRMRLPWFVPVAFISGLTSAVVGGSGLLANPFYLNYGLTKEGMLATRAVNSMTIQFIKISAYLAFGVMSWDLVGHGIAIGLGAVLAIWLTRPWLSQIDPFRFRRLAVSVMVIAGLLILWQQRLSLLSLLRS
jgi:uncharacterized membrane protein YfcA